MSLVPFQRLDWTSSFNELQVINESDYPEMTTANGHISAMPVLIPCLTSINTREQLKP